MPQEIDGLGTNRTGSAARRKRQVAKVKGVKTEKFVPPLANHVPHLRITWAGGPTPAEVIRRFGVRPIIDPLLRAEAEIFHIDARKSAGSVTAVAPQVSLR